MMEIEKALPFKEDTMQIADNPKTLAQSTIDTLTQYREQLLAAGFHEPLKRNSASWHWLFYKTLTDLTAFIVNLQGCDAHVGVVYGCASTAFTRMANDSDALISLGVNDAEITLRECVSIRDASDEASAAEAIRQMYREYASVEKDALLSLAKEKRKAFIQRFAVKLKPLGFKKKGNYWIKSMPEGYELTFYLQKSSYSDKYYFNVWLRRPGMPIYGCCYDERFSLPEACNDNYCMDWQLTSPDIIEAFLEDCILPRLLWLMNTPYDTLGAAPALWQHCNCQRTHCTPCWVQKNLWEARESEPTI